MFLLSVLSLVVIHVSAETTTTEHNPFVEILNTTATGSDTTSTTEYNPFAEGLNTTTTVTSTTMTDCSGMSCRENCENYFTLCMSTEGCAWSDDTWCTTTDGLNTPDCCI